MEVVLDAIPPHIYPDIIRTMGAPPIITREWLNTYQFGCMGSSKNPIYYIDLQPGYSIRLANGTYITESCYIPYDTMLPIVICYKDNVELGAYGAGSGIVNKVHTTTSLYGLKWTIKYFVTNKLMTNIGYFGFTCNGMNTYREVLVNGTPCRLTNDINKGVERCRIIRYTDIQAGSNLLHTTVLQMLTDYTIGDEMTLLDDTTGMANRLFLRIVNYYNRYLKSIVPLNPTSDWCILKMREGDWVCLLKYPASAALIFSELVKSPDGLKTMTTEVYDMIMAQSKEYKINPEIVRKFVKTNALKYGREDLANYVGITQTKCRRPSPLGGGQAVGTEGSMALHSSRLPHDPLASAPRDE